MAQSRYTSEISDRSKSLGNANTADIGQAVYVCNTWTKKDWQVIEADEAVMSPALEAANTPALNFIWKDYKELYVKNGPKLATFFILGRHLGYLSSALT
jgi:hypothetical protein